MQSQSRQMPPLEYAASRGLRNISKLGAVLCAALSLVLAACSADPSTMLALQLAVPAWGLVGFILGLLPVLRRRSHPRRGLWIAVVGMVVGIVLPTLFIAYALLLWVVLSRAKW
jgi:hypothetical protein